MASTDSLQGCEDEDYIDMELSSSPRSREFEFQMCSNPKEEETNTCTADELFYKGKLLPLHLITSSITARDEITKDSDTMMLMMPLACATAPCTNTNNTPLDSCNISPSESRRVSCELNPDDCFFEWSTELSSFIHHRDRTIRKKSWAQKLKLMRHYTFAQKLKASRAYLKSLFHKSAGSDEICVKANVSFQDDKSFEFEKKKRLEFMGRANSYYPTIAAILKNGSSKNGIGDNVQRRSFSGAIKRHTPAKCLSSLSSSNSSSGSSSSSSSFSLHSNGLNEVNLTRRSSSATETEDSIEAAIAHCKESHKASNLRKKPEIFCSLSACDR